MEARRIGEYVINQVRAARFMRRPPQHGQRAADTQRAPPWLWVL